MPIFSVSGLWKRPWPWGQGRVYSKDVCFMCGSLLSCPLDYDPRFDRLWKICIAGSVNKFKMKRGKGESGKSPASIVRIVNDSQVLSNYYRTEEKKHRTKVGHAGFVSRNSWWKGMQGSRALQSMRVTIWAIIAGQVDLLTIYSTSIVSGIGDDKISLRNLRIVPSMMNTTDKYIKVHGGVIHIAWG